MLLLSKIEARQVAERRHRWTSVEMVDRGWTSVVVGMDIGGRGDEHRWTSRRMCVNMCVDMCVNTCADMCVGMCVETCADMSTDMCVDGCMHMCVCMMINSCGR